MLNTSLNLYALMLCVYGIPSEKKLPSGRKERVYPDDPDECINYLLTGKWTTDKNRASGIINKERFEQIHFNF